MEFKKSIVYFYTVQKQLQIPLNRYVYNIRCNAIDLFEKNKKQEVKNYKYDLNYTLFTSRIKRIRKLHLEYFDSFRIFLIDSIYHYDSKISIRSLSKAFYLKEYALNVDVSYEKFLSKKRAVFSQEGIFLYITDGMFVKKPIEILYISTGTFSKMFRTINLIILGKGSCVKIIELYKNLSLGKEKFFISSEVYMNAYSYLDYCKIKDDRPTSYFLDHSCILQEDRSECNINSFSFCGKSIINFLSIYQLGMEIHSHINGLSILKGHIIHNSLIEHISANGKSRDVYKGIFDKMADTTFNGKIIVLKSAKKTNAFQKSSNILLSSEVKVNANPQLEIFAEDVVCSHGCIVGQLNPQEIFYLRSRGIPKADAITKLLVAFSKDILECLFFQRLKNLISKKINKNVIPSRN